jgi:hypothetical protein
MQEELSPDQRTLVIWSESDGRMSHVIRTPAIVDAAGGGTILKLGDSGYDATIDWGGDGGFDLDLRHYWRAGTLRLTVDRSAGTFRIAGAGDDQPAHRLGELSAFVEDHFTAADREAMRNATDLSLEERLERQLRSGSRALWLMLAIGAGAAIWALVSWN